MRPYGSGGQAGQLAGPQLLQDGRQLPEQLAPGPAEPLEGADGDQPLDRAAVQPGPLDKIGQGPEWPVAARLDAKNDLLIETDRTIRPANDTRDLGVRLNDIEWTPR